MAAAAGRWNSGYTVPASIPFNISRMADVAPMSDGELRQFISPDYIGASPVDGSESLKEEAESGFNDEYKLPPIDDVRCHGLTTNHYDEDPLHFTYIPPPPRSIHADLQDPHGVLNIGTIVSLNALNGHNMHEKWDIDKQSAEFLASVIPLGGSNQLEEAWKISEPMRTRELKIEEAILSTDPELDLLKLKKRNVVTLSTHGLEQFPLDDQKDESLRWPDSRLSLPGETEWTIANEKFEVGRDTMAYIKEIADPGPGDCKSIPEICDQYRIRPSITSTPPLLPLSPPLELGNLSSAVDRMELTSTPDDLVAMEAAVTDRRILELDSSSTPQKAPGFDNQKSKSEVDDVYYALRTPVESSSSPLRRKRSYDLHADVPLIPRSPTESATKKVKTVSFPEELQTIIPRLESDASVPHEDDAENDVDAFIASVVMPLAESANEQVDNEQLVEVDTMMRVQVPSVDEVSPSPPWSGARDLKVQRVLLSKSYLEKNENSWGGVSKIERLLPWSPFPVRLGKIQVDETLDNGSLASFMADVAFDEDACIGSLVWKPDGLRILDDQDDRIEKPEQSIFIEDGSYDPVERPTTIMSGSRRLDGPRLPSDSIAPPTPEPMMIETVCTDMQALLKKRRMELHAADPSKGNRAEVDPAEPNDAEPIMERKAHNTKSTRIEELTGAGSLTGFLHLHGGPIGRVEPPAREQDFGHSSIAPTAIMVKPVVQARVEKVIESMPLPTPDVRVHSEKSSVVLSSNMVENRQITRKIQKALPNLDIIERDHISRSTTNPHAKANPNPDREADITISPSTGIMITTLQKLKQRPLPGQLTFLGTLEHIKTVSHRYERLVVLVSEGQRQTDDDSTVAAPLDDRDATALSDLIGSASLLNIGIEVYYVAGGELELARWIAGFITRHSISDLDAKLLQEETLWERLLRKAGINAFAAQIILGMLKMPKSSAGSDISTRKRSNAAVYGLAGFVRMTFDQRVERFGPLTGGDKVLCSTSKVIDGGWVSDLPTRL